MNLLIRISCLLCLAGCRLTSASDIKSESGSTANELNKKHFNLVSQVPANTCLDVQSSRTHAGIPIQQYACNGTHAQNFRFERNLDDSFRILSIKGGKCLDTQGEQIDDGTSILTNNCGSSPSQKFQVLDQSNGLLSFKNVKSGKCLEVENASSSDGGRVQLSACIDTNAQKWAPVVNNTPLRIMPLGASITQGFGSTHAGTRQYLHELLSAENYPHLFVGSNSDQPGQLPPDQRQHEGHPGWTIENIIGRAQGVSERTREWVTAAKPDAVIILLGTNDIVANNDIDHMGDRLYRLIDQISNLQSGAARDARVLVASLPVIKNPDEEARGLRYRDQIIQVADRFHREGKNVGFVDVHPLISVSELADNVHPNDSGHKKIAQAWFDRFLGR